MSLIRIGEGETETIAAGESRSGNPVNLGGTLNLAGELNVTDVGVAASTAAGSDATAAPPEGSKTAAGNAGAGVTTDAFVSLPGQIRAAAAAGVATGDGLGMGGIGDGPLGETAGVLQGSKPVVAAAAGGATATLAVSASKPARGGVAAGSTGIGVVAGRKGLAVSIESGASMTGLLTKIVPMRRTNTATIVFDDTESFELTPGDSD